MVSGHRVPRRVGGWRSRAASDGESEFYHSGAEPRWGFSTIKQSAEEALCVPLITKLKAKINTHESGFFLVIDRKGKCRSRVCCALNLENMDCGTWQGCTQLARKFHIFSFFPLILSKIKGGKQHPSAR